MATTLAAAPPPPCGAKLESLTYIDIAKLSQSELLALSLCSDSSFNLHSTDDVVIPKIDRSLFNESAGGRRQTYSRLRAGYHQYPHPHGTRLPRPNISPSSDPESNSILHYLKHYLLHNSPSTCPTPPSVPAPLHGVSGESDQQLALGLQEKMAIVVHEAERKRKRGRRAGVKANVRLLENGVGDPLERVNRKGEEVDFVFLESKGDEVFEGELKRRTAGLETEEGVMDFLRGLPGEWGSRRKRRKFVDASHFGDALPVGWKLLLGLRRRGRREGRVALYCRRIVSPTGEQFLSCKDVSSFLHSHFDGKVRNQKIDLGKSIVGQAKAVVSGSNAGLPGKADGINSELHSDSTIAYLTASEAQEHEICLMGIDNLPDVQVLNVFECHKCKLTYDEKNAYLHHLMSFHQRTTRRYKFGGPIGEGVIIRDGKFECQFCHKVFLERRSYNGHVGVHVRNHTKGSEEVTVPEATQKNNGTPSRDDFHAIKSKMNASAEIAQSSLEVGFAGSNSQVAKASCHSLVSLNGTLTETGNQGFKLHTSPSRMDMETSQSDIAACQMLDQQGSDGKLAEDIDGQVAQNLESIRADGSELSGAKEMGTYGNNESELGFGYSGSELNENVAASKGLVVEENLISSPAPPVTLSDYFPDTSNKANDDFCPIEPKHEMMSVFEELGLDEMETLKYGFVDREESSSLPVVSGDLPSNAGVEAGFDSAVGFDSDRIMLNMAGTHQLATVCVWCRAEFKIETFDTEFQTDSIGYMCPSCKDKISGHFDRLCP